MTFQPAPQWDGDPPDHRRLLEMAHELGPISNKGDHVRRLAVDWLVFDRVDRAGMPVCLCRPAGGEVEAVRSRARKGRVRG